MGEPKYGTMNKKVIFYDSDKRYADGKERLDKLALGEEEIENIFDILEKQNPDL